MNKVKSGSKPSKYKGFGATLFFREKRNVFKERKFLVGHVNVKGYHIRLFAFSQAACVCQGHAAVCGASQP